jgi:hypothetical protein
MTSQSYARFKLQALFLAVLLVAGLLLALVGPSAAKAASFDLANGDIAGLISAINQANANGQSNTINLASNGTYVLTAVDNSPASQGANGLPVISSDLTINGNGATLQRDPNAPSFRLFYISGQGKLTLNNLSLRNGKGDTYSGGAALNAGGKLVLNGCTISANSATFEGAGIYNYGRTSPATLTVTNSTFSTNTSGLGAAILNRADGATTSLTITNSTFSNNTGAAIYHTSSNNPYPSSLATLNVTGTLFSANTGGGIHIIGTGQDETSVNDTTFLNNGGSYGGGIYHVGYASNIPSTLMVTNSTFVGNSVSGDGGGIYNSASGSAANASVTNSTFYGNSAGGGGGGLYNSGYSNAASLLIVNSTISANSAASGKGGGVYNSNLPAQGATATLTLRNSLLVANSTENCANNSPFADGTNNLEYPGPTALCGVGSAVSGNSPLVAGGPTDNGGPTKTIGLAGPPNPAIDNANSADCPATDQRHFNRVGLCDIGAYEYTACNPQVVNSTQDDGNTCGTLRYALTYLGQHPELTNKVIDVKLATTPATLQLSGGGLTIPAGVTINGVCNPTTQRPEITLDGTNLPGPGLILNGKDTLTGLKLTGFKDRQLQALKGANRLKCVVVKRN